jgi:hypothetical protein
MAAAGVSFAPGTNSADGNSRGAGGPKVQTNIGLDGKPTNIRLRQNVFEEENVISEKEKLRERMVSDQEGMKNYIKTMTPTDIFILFDEDDSGLISYMEFRKM